MSRRPGCSPSGTSKGQRRAFPLLWRLTSDLRLFELGKRGPGDRHSIDPGKCEPMLERLVEVGRNSASNVLPISEIPSTRLSSNDAGQAKD